jgi:hypothetical protein
MAFLFHGLRLCTPLGHCLFFDKAWEWYYSPSLDYLLQSQQGSWRSFSKIHKRDRLPLFTSSGTFALPPADMERATVYQNKNRIVCSGHVPVINEPNLATESFLQHLSVAAPGEHWCFDYLTLTDDGSTIAQALQHGDAIAISDGSFHVELWAML